MLSSNNEHVNSFALLYNVVGCCSQSAIPRRGFYLYNDVIVTLRILCLHVFGAFVRNRSLLRNSHIMNTKSW